ncbi:MAG: hypothetical protein IKH30_01290, partial [Clostridia bacterium]|nr:hypothetical protein [Clostridia bacterium]
MIFARTVHHPSFQLFGGKKELGVRNEELLLAQLNHELSAGDKSVHPASLNLEIPPVFLRFRSLSGTISHPASEF